MFLCGLREFSKPNLFKNLLYKLWFTRMFAFFHMQGFHSTTAAHRIFQVFWTQWIKAVTFIRSWTQMFYSYLIYFFLNVTLILWRPSVDVGAFSKHINPRMSLQHWDHPKPNTSEEITSINFGHRAEVQKSRLPLRNPPPPHFHWLLISIYMPWGEIMKTRWGGGGKPRQAFWWWMLWRRMTVYRVSCSTAAVPAAVPRLRKGLPQ